MADLPRGLVTFLFTDVEGSTSLWKESPESTGLEITVKKLLSGAELLM